MTKYDFQVDLSLNSSTGIILNKLKKGSTVLEFGCAAGRMTRYMKEELDCQVYIVEYEQSAYEKALEYAVDGVCGDIMQFAWVEKFKGIQFDAIIFADVLEHLTEPEKALEAAAKLLKDSGSLYISVPNVTHNDILLKAVEERFDYTATGLLDDTHVHFWGLENIKALDGKFGLHMKRVEGTYCPTGATEQYENVERSHRPLLENLLRERQCGEVYQFLITFEKKAGGEPVYVFRKPSVKSHIYVDTGSDFNDEEKIAFTSHYAGNGIYKLRFVVKNTKSNIRRVRLDPVEGHGCILRNLSIHQGSTARSWISPRAVTWENEILLTGNDPMLLADVEENSEPITIDAEMILPGEQYLAAVENAYEAQQAEYKKQKAEYADFQAKAAAVAARKQELEEKLAAAVAENKANKRMLNGLTAENRDYRRKTAALAKENNELRRDVSAYIILANNKEKYILSLKQKIRELEGKLGEYMFLAENRAKYIHTLEEAMQYYEGLLVVKVRGYLVRGLRKGMRKLKQYLR